MKKKRNSPHEETCQRCGEVGLDRRTLWMSCFYDMSELGLPFEIVKVKGKIMKKIGEKHLPFFKAKIDKFSSRGKDFDLSFYKLRVCKDCRADWLSTIGEWFKIIPPRINIGSGIFIRDFGTAREVTREVYDKINGAHK